MSASYGRPALPPACWVPGSMDGRTTGIVLYTHRDNGRRTFTIEYAAEWAYLSCELIPDLDKAVARLYGDGSMFSVGPDRDGLTVHYRVIRRDPGLDALLMRRDREGPHL